MFIKKKINLNTISSTKKDFESVATEEELKELSTFLEICEVKNLSFNFSLYRKNKDFILQGNILSEIVQECAISAEDIDFSLNVSVNRCLRFQKEDQNTKNEKRVIDLSFLSEPQDWENDEIDIIHDLSFIPYVVISEELFLNIDPYLKKQ